MRKIKEIGHRVAGVAPNSIAAEMGIVCGDRLIEIDGMPIYDVLDYKARCETEYLELLVQTKKGEIIFEIEKEEQEDLGLYFEPALMDEKRRCQNKCAFCFIDQLPPNTREVLHFKDDDFRLSFLMGNYISLTNLSESDWERITSQRISPLYISVHCTDADLRARIMKNPRAAGIQAQLHRLKDAGVQFHCQIVLMKDYNDGQVLQSTLDTLAAFRPMALSVAIVPVGLTNYRDGLEKLQPIDAACARQTIAIAEQMNQKLKSAFVFCADEFYLLAHLPIPPEDFYGDYPQIEDGIGMLRKFIEEAELALQTPIKPVAPYKATVILGQAAYPILQPYVKRIETILGGQLHAIAGKNTFFGERITVSGLLTGQDFINIAQDLDLGECLFIPGNSLRDDGVFLDDMTLNELEHLVGKPVIPLPQDGGAFVNLLLTKGGNRR